jgi:hypothetical protein
MVEFTWDFGVNYPIRKTGVVVEYNGNGYQIAHHHEGKMTKSWIFKTNVSCLSDTQHCQEYAEVNSDSSWSNIMTSNMFNNKQTADVVISIKHCRVPDDKQIHNEIKVHTYQNDDKSFVFHEKRKIIIIHAHKAILAAHSDYFQAAFFGPFQQNIIETKTDVVDLRNDKTVSNTPQIYEIELPMEVDEKNLITFFSYLYSGVFSIHLHQFVDCWHLADFFQVSTLINRLKRYCFREPLTDSNVCNLLLKFTSYCVQCNATAMCLDYIGKHFESIVSNHCETLSFDILSMCIEEVLLYHDNDVEKTFHTILLWRTVHVEVEEEKYRKLLRANIQWWDMRPSFLVDVVQPTQILDANTLHHLLLLQQSACNKKTYKDKLFLMGMHESITTFQND